MTDQTKSLADVQRNIERVSPGIVAKAAEFQAAILADVNGRRGALHGRIAPLSPSMKVAGPAITVDVRPGDNLMIHAAMAIAQPGDVLVIDGKGDQSCALMGAIMMNQCKAMKLAGVIVDAAVRDIEEIRALGFPVFSVGSNPNGPTKLVSGRVNWPVSVGGVNVKPGDLVVGDADGVVVIEREKAESLLAPAAKKLEDETKRIQGILDGKQLRPTWLDGALRAAGVLKEGETL
ncbi:RraA family protein [Noviherbaspirillum denitrificans]|uniref:Putative 4-hydroxy-4-methyl-2-oxoglutarate aldolase n=1 Tax=Noviherbaspirillum denitrificans TaxID=1968433 RepID=A0A254TT61_9BURK|nr:methyltransferase [Noviherbaspirillum denitrificans]OWW22918.1 methyltransferase [Noviherbaspirillum denitrificans]